jgi:formylglycine-generating enzyme required for sulfatase activity
VTPASTQEVAQPSMQEQPLKAKDVFKDCANCPEMVVVPAGSFKMGSPTSEPGHSAEEGPHHLVTIARPFAVGRSEVTFDEWDACVAEGGCNGYKPSDEGWGRGRRPVVNVSWDDAQSYVTWLSKKTRKSYRLLSGSEYEYAMRAGTQTVYPWGDTVGTNNANCHSCGSQWDAKQTAPVGSFPPNGFGLYDMVGNVREWTEDCYHDTYNGAPTDGSAWLGGGDCYHRVVRGGSFLLAPAFLRSASRYWFTSDYRLRYLGFRVARTLAP